MKSLILAAAALLVKRNSGRFLDKTNVFSCTLFGLEQVCNS